MKTVLVALNAKYIHTNLAVRSVAAYARQAGWENIEIWERTINHRPRQMLRELAEQAADVVVFSCYIWNIELIRALAADLRRLCPEMVLVAAGPQVSYHSDEFLAANPAFDLILPGEGEEATAALLGWLAKGEQVQGTLPPPPPMELDRLVFPYFDLEQLEGRVLYYESMRGCPFSCSYCLSSVEKGVRFRSLDLVFADLDRFLAAGVGQVKLVDRTFNCNKARAMAIWRYLADHDNGVTNFHFELAGELLDDEAAELLSTVRPGQFQFEIGVQSTNAVTLAAIRRPADLSRLFAAVERLRRPRNIHLHLDLIAGLPYEGFDSFAQSFDAVYALGPDQFQLGFLKVLGGSAMEVEAEAHGIAYQAAAPFEVLSTRWLSFAQLTRLSRIAEMVDTFYNSGRFSHLIGEMCGGFQSPFGFYSALADYFQAGGHEEAPLSKLGYYELLGGFLQDRGGGITPRHQWLCKYDMALHEKIRKLPSWVEVDGFSPHRGEILAFLSDGDNLARYLPQYAECDAKFIARVAHIEVFPFHPETGEDGPCTILLNYGFRDLLGRAKMEIIPL